MMWLFLLLLGTLSTQTLAAKKSGIPMEARLPIDCSHARTQGNTKNGVYFIKPRWSNDPFPIYCEVRGKPRDAWTILQRRTDGTIDFYRNWDAYRVGFGDPNNEFWVGNQNLFYLTSQRRYKLRVEITLQGSHEKVFAEYDRFHVEGRGDKYRLRLGKRRDSNNTASEGFLPGFNLDYHNNMQFSTYDVDNGMSSHNCGSEYKGGWWYRTCHYWNLNGQYGCYSTSCLVVHYRGHYHGVEAVTMKIQPVNNNNKGV